MKSLTMLWQVVAEELGDMCGVSTTRDVETLARRIEHEGLSFLTITLPRFGKDFERSLDLGNVAPNAFQGFAQSRAGLPRFLGGFLELVFDRASGLLVDEPCVESIFAVRQLTLLFGKVEVPCSPERVATALEGFVNCEQEVKEADAHRPDELSARFRQVGSLLWADVIQAVENDLYLDESWAGWTRERPYPAFVPKHGPGATADRRSGNRKYDFAEYTERLERVFPARDYLIPNEGHFTALDRVDFREPGAERPVRVVTVPKTLETPRIIAIEPTYMQYMQQGLKDMIVPAIQNHPVMGRIVGFDDQHVNRAMAYEGSLTRSLATLDLSEASDRVSNQLAQDLFARWRYVNAAVQATRSMQADVPGHGVIPLAKFASMGSALTFPVEAMVFATVVFVGIENALTRPLTSGDVKSLSRQVRVYGDDIIVPVQYTRSVVQALEDFGFRVNTRKSFWTGWFRESCGREYYRGHDVSIVRARALVRKGDVFELPSQRRFVRETESLVALRNKFYLAGLWRTARFLDRKIHVLLDGWYPTVPVEVTASREDVIVKSRALARWSVLPYRGSTSDPQKWSASLHAPLVRGWVTTSTLPASKASDVGSLLKVLAPRGEPFEDAKHLERAGRPESARMKLRWTSPV